MSNWSIPKNTFTQIAFAQIHIFGPRFLFWREKMCKFTQIMCKLHKSWSTRGHVDQGSQLHKSHLHKSQNQLKQPLWIHHPLASFRFFECVETQVGGRNRKKFRQAILLNGVTILRGNRKCYLRCVFFGAYTTH